MGRIRQHKQADLTQEEGKMQEIESGVHQEAREKHCPLCAPGSEQTAASHIPLLEPRERLVQNWEVGAV